MAEGWRVRCLVWLLRKITGRWPAVTAAKTAQLERDLYPPDPADERLQTGRITLNEQRAIAGYGFCPDEPPPGSAQLVVTGVDPDQVEAWMAAYRKKGLKPIVMSGGATYQRVDSRTVQPSPFVQEAGQTVRADD